MTRKEWCLVQTSLFFLFFLFFLFYFFLGAETKSLQCLIFTQNINLFCYDSHSAALEVCGPVSPMSGFFCLVTAKPAVPVVWIQPNEV